MRINFWRSPALPLAGCLLAGGLPAAAQQGPPEIEPASAEEEARGRSVFTGNHTVAEGDTVEDVVVVGGDLRVRGTVTGDAVVVGGRLILDETGMIHGDATVTGGTIVESGGSVRGEMRMLDASGGMIESGAAAAATSPPLPDRETRGVVQNGRGDRDFFGRGSAFRAIRDGFLGVVSTIALGLVLAGIGAVLIFYGRPQLDTVSDTIRGATVRSAVVGLAATFLIVPAFIVLVVALAVSIIGIPLLILAIPLYPLALAAAFAFGLLAAAHAIGERTSEQRNDGFDFRYRNSYAYLFTGLGMLLAPLVAANLISMTGFLSFIGILLKIVTVTVSWAAATVGLGAVILSRGGTQRSFVKPPPDLGFDPDPFLDSEPPAPNAHA
jgi:hypothetical protein